MDAYELARAAEEMEGAGLQGFAEALRDMAHDSETRAAQLATIVPVEDDSLDRLEVSPEDRGILDPAPPPVERVPDDEGLHVAEPSDDDRSDSPDVEDAAIAEDQEPVIDTDDEDGAAVIDQPLTTIVAEASQEQPVNQTAKRPTLSLWRRLVRSAGTS
jgi:hypothetical protein